MLFDQQLDGAARHIQKAQGHLQGIESREPSFTSEVQGHLTAALGEIARAQETGEASRPEAPRGHRQAPNGRSRASSELGRSLRGMLSLLLRQMNETSRRLEPLAPEAEKPPLRQLEETDLRPIAETLGNLRRLTGRMEAELRLLDTQVRDAQTGNSQTKDARVDRAGPPDS